MASRNAKLGTGAAIVLALAGGIGALFMDRKPAAPAAAIVAEIADVSSDTVLARLFEKANANVTAIVAQIRSGEGKIDTAALHKTIADLDAQLKLEMAKPQGGSQTDRSRMVRELVDLQSKLHALDTDADFLVSYSRMHQDKLTNMQRMYRNQPRLVSFCTAMVGYLNTTLRAPPAQHADWPNLILTLHGETIDGLIAMVDAQTTTPLTLQDKAALAHFLNTYPQVMARVPALKRLIEKNLR